MYIPIYQLWYIAIYRLQAISDVILGTQRAVFKSFEDKYLYNILPNQELCKIFENDTEIETILFTSGNLRNTTLMMNGRVNVSSPNTLNIFLTIVQNCNPNANLLISGEPDGTGTFYPFANAGIRQASIDQDNHIIWWLKLNGKKFRMINLPSPSGRASQSIGNRIL